MNVSFYRHYLFSSYFIKHSFAVLIKLFRNLKSQRRLLQPKRLTSTYIINSSNLYYFFLLFSILSVLVSFYTFIYFKIGRSTKRFTDLFVDLPILKYILILSFDLQQSSLYILPCIYIYIYIYISLRKNTNRSH